MVHVTTGEDPMISKDGAQKFIQYRLDMYKFGLILFTMYEFTISYVVTSNLGIFKG